MKTNIGDADRTLRCVVGATLGWLSFAHIPYGTLRITLALIAAWLLLTTVTAWSPLYALFRFSTIDLPKSASPTRIK